RTGYFTINLRARSSDLPGGFMLRQFYSAVFVVALLIATIPVTADSVPVIEGYIAGVELCPQSICGSAILTGEFFGHVNGRPERGVFLGAITHDPQTLASLPRLRADYG